MADGGNMAPTGVVMAPTGVVKEYIGRTTSYVILASLMAASGGLMFGYDIGISGGVTSMDDFLRKFFPDVVKDMNSGHQTNYCMYNNQKLQAFTSSLYMSGLVYTFAASYTSRLYGRRASMRLASLNYIIVTTLCAASPALAVLIIGRIFLGIGIGFANQAVPLFLSELAPAKYRGTLNTLFQLAVTLGILFANLVNYGTNNIAGWGWRLSLAGAGVPAIILAVGTLIVPETPNSLIERGHMEEGKQVLKKIRGTEDVEVEYQDIVAASEFAKTIKHPIKTILQRQYYPMLLISFFLQLFQQFAGINAIEFYAPVLFKTLGFGSDASLYSAVIIGVVNSLSTLVAVFYSDRIGRRKLLLQACVQMSISQMIIGVLLGIYLKDAGSLPSAVSITVVVFICTFVASFAWSWGPLGWLIPSEIFPLETRSLGQSFTVSSNLLFTFIIAQSFLSMLCGMRYGIFLFFTAWIVVMFFFVIFFLPETKGIPIEEMNYVFANHWLWKRFVSRLDMGEEEKDVNNVP